MLYDYRPMEVANIIYGLCLPSECNTRDVLQLTNSVLDKYSLPLDVVRVNCEKKSEGRELTSWEIAACCFLASVVILVLVGTFIDLCTSRDILNRSKTGRILRGFSFYTNAKEVAETASRAGTFGCFHGMRVISLLWVMLSHSLFLAYPDQITVFKPLSGNLKISRTPIMALLDNASPSVDTFFVISGFLCAYSTWKSLEINGDRIDILSILLRKLWRLSPSMWATIALTMLLPRLGNGPLWKENSEYLAGACQRNGWTNLLFLQNLWSMEDMCLVHTWYVACLMQLFVIGVPLLQLCYRRFWLGLGVGVTLASTGMAVCMLLTVLYGLPPAPLYSSYGVHAIVKHVSFQLIKPHQHIGAFLIGAATGYIYFKRGKAPIPKVYVVLGWIVSLAAMSGVVFGVQSFRTDKVYEGPVAVLYSGVFRNIWATAVAWICFACVTGRGGLVNDLLSLSPFSSLARLSYAAYLLHPLLICYHTSRIRFPYYFDYITLGDRYVSYVVITFVFAYFFHLMIEMPFSNAERVLLDTKKKAESKES
ncbi:nose resistant to fluoxetine protein 6-like [Centruroides vittatus]|uniref:nose resistant to fluoxetine protein 6-like n=1 Tax=Centruroides vittatus TaxID=120091 RepID=UPI00350FA116